jgi:hypothetical protein
VPDGGTALLHCQVLGPKAQVVVDTGHHAPGGNIEFIVAMLLRADKLGGFDFNSRFYADDDLMVGAADPFQLFRIMHEVVKAGALHRRPPAARRVAPGDGTRPGPGQGLARLRIRRENRRGTGRRHRRGCPTGRPQKEAV